jgi:hypothetical protein
MNGRGTFTWKNDGRCYVGQYVLDKKHGEGVFRWPDGREYRGSWRQGKQDGVGVFLSQNGQLRQGLWKDGVRTRWLSDEYSKDDKRASAAEGVMNIHDENWDVDRALSVAGIVQSSLGTTGKDAGAGGSDAVDPQPPVDSKTTNI